MRNLPVNTLQFDQIKQNFKDFLKGKSPYADWNFDGSGISTILDIASYQTHYIGFFVKMLLDESFVDTAHTLQAQYSHAKRVGYIPRGRKSATAEVILSVHTDTTSEPEARSIDLERGATFSSTNTQNDTRTFCVLDGTTIYNREQDGSDVTYTSDLITVYEGTLRTWKFEVDGDVVNQRFTIRDPNIDIDTIRVSVRENSSATDATEYKLPKDIDTLTPDSHVFFVTTDENGHYQVFFGNGVFGVQPADGNAIDVTYISTNGPSGNGARSFVFNAPAAGGSTTNIGNFEDFQVVTSSPSSGGLDPQSVEELRYSIPNHYRRQDRLVTENDYRSILLDEFRNIDSINVWGGETNSRRMYGKVMVSIKPKFADTLTVLAKEQIRNSIIRRYGVVGSDVVFIDPDFINVDLTVRVKFDQRKTVRSAAEINQLVRESVMQYSENELSRFDRELSDVDLLDSIRDDERAITSLYSEKMIWKNVPHIHRSTSSNVVEFSNEIDEKTFYSSAMTYGTFANAILKDVYGDGTISLIDGNTGAVVVRNSGTINYKTGAVEFSLPVAVRVKGFESSVNGLLVFTAVPSIPDISTTQNNIVRISKVKSVATAV